jgi:type IV secretory pathway TraG/TraD family ATPase VirD4
MGKRAIANASEAWGLSTPLLSFSKRDQLTIGRAFEGIAIFGAIGSGKSSGSGRCIALSMLAAGYGFLVLCAKSDEAAMWEEYARQTGRLADFVRFRADGTLRFDPFFHELVRKGEGAGHTENIVGLLSTLLEIADRNTGQGGGGREDEGYWKRALRQLLRNLVDLLVLAKGTVSVPDLYRLVVTAPTSLDNVRSAEWRQQSFLFQCMAEADKQSKTTRQQHDFEIVADYFMLEFPGLSDKTRSVIVSTFTSMVDVLNRGLLRELFCNGTNISPEATEEGKIIVVDIPVKEYGDVGLFAATLWKYAWQKSIERRNVVTSPRPVALWCDEAHTFLTSYDMQFQTTCRAARAATVLLSQNLSNYYAMLGGSEKGKAVADSLLGNLNLKIFHANGDHVTNEWMAAMIGRSRQLVGNSSSTSSVPTDAVSAALGIGMPQISAGVSEIYEFEVQPAICTTLRTGGPANGWLVDSIIFSNGVCFQATGRPYLFCTISQK